MYKKLYRSNKDKMIGGVAGGIAEYFEIDPTIVRILFVLLVFFGGGGLIAYIILWIIVPERPYIFMGMDQNQSDLKSESANSSSSQEQSEEKTSENQNTINIPDFQKRQKSNSSFVAGMVLIVIGGLFFLDNFIPRFDFGDFWPIILIAVGIGLLLNARK